MPFEVRADGIAQSLSSRNGGKIFSSAHGREVDVSTAPRYACRSPRLACPAFTGRQTTEEPGCRLLLPDGATPFRFRRL